MRNRLGGEISPALVSSGIQRPARREVVRRGAEKAAKILREHGAGPGNVRAWRGKGLICPAVRPPAPLRCPRQSDYFFAGGDDLAASGYLARSARHFLNSSGLFVAVYNATSRSAASGRRSWPCGEIIFSRPFIPA